jgi:hypothetical protein
MNHPITNAANQNAMITPVLTSSFQRQRDYVGARCHIDSHPVLRSQSLTRRSMAEKTAAIQAAPAAHAAHSLC